MYNIHLIPPHLSNMGVKRATPKDVPDLITVAKTPFPVLARYVQVCNKMDVVPFAGGTWAQQGPKYKVGYITSGYREELTRDHSPHCYALALDIAVGDITEQIRWGDCAIHFYTRIGFYPDSGFIHVDLAPIVWMKAYGGTRYWIKVGEKYYVYRKYNKLLIHAKSLILH